MDHEFGWREAVLCVSMEAISTEPVQVILLGATRSGTSVTAGVLSGLGVNFGSNIRPADTHNPFGYFEDRGFLDLNGRILAAAGGNFIRPPAHHDIVAQRAHFEPEIAELVASRNEGLWGWKTTTTCLTLELFLPHLSNPRLIFLTRDPLATARSQLSFTENQLRLTESLRLVVTYYVRTLDVAERHRGVPLFCLSYEELLRDPVATASRLADFLQLSLPPDQLRSAAAIVTGRGGRATQRSKLTLASWRSLQVARIRFARGLVRQQGIVELASHVRTRLHKSRKEIDQDRAIRPDPPGSIEASDRADGSHG